MFMLLYPIVCALLPGITSAVTSASSASLIRTSHYTMGEAQVSICREVDPSKARSLLAGRHRKRELDGAHQKPHTPGVNSAAPARSPSPHETMDLTPANYSMSCYPGNFQPPLPEDCEVVFAAETYNSTGSLRAFPGEYVFVSYGTCATVFQNPQGSDYNLEYNWAELGTVGKTLADNCLAHDDMGGAALIEPYLGRNYSDIVISLQRFDDRDFIIPQ